MPSMRTIAATLALATLLSTAGPVVQQRPPPQMALLQVECKDIRDPYTCNRAPGCGWSERLTRPHRVCIGLCVGRRRFH
jgi:hypothetical protein